MAEKKVLTNQILVEVMDPDQSCDYIEIGGRTFPVQVLSISLEKKVIRIAQRMELEYQEFIPTVCSEILRYNDPYLSLDWALDNSTIEEMERFYTAYLGKMVYNDIVEDTIDDIIAQIKWKPIDPKRRDELVPYLPASVFTSAFIYGGIVEGKTVSETWHGMTRGMFAIHKLNNMIQNDRMRIVDKEAAESDRIGNVMKTATTAEEYLAGLASQGMSVKDGI